MLYTNHCHTVDSSTRIGKIAIAGILFKALSFHAKTKWQVSGTDNSVRC